MNRLYSAREPRRLLLKISLNRRTESARARADQAQALIEPCQALIDRPPLLCKMGLGVGPKGPERKQKQLGKKRGLWVILVQKTHGVRCDTARAHMWGTHIVYMYSYSYKMQKQKEVKCCAFILYPAEPRHDTFKTEHHPSPGGAEP